MTTLTVELANEQMRVLERVAAQRGLSVPAIMSDLVAQYTASQSAANGSKLLEDVKNDPLWKICGAINSGTPDLSARHDDYLAQSYTETHNHE